MKDFLNKIKEASVLVIGDLMLDHYLLGDAHRISPEAPVPVVQVQSETYIPGGAANVACNLNALGAKTILCGLLGEDFSGQTLLQLLQKQEISTDAIICSSHLKSIQKTRVIARQQQLCRIDSEPESSSYAAISSELLERIDPWLSKVQAIILSDYAKGVLTQKCLDGILEKAKRHGIFVALDPNPKNDLEHSGLDLLKPNRSEALHLAEIFHDHPNAFPEKLICERIFKKHAPKNLVLSLGNKGLLLCQEGHVIQQLPTYAQEVYDVSGAGDTVIAALTLAMTCKASLLEAAHFANTAAGVVIQKIGTATPTPEEILNFSQAHKKSYS